MTILDGIYNCFYMSLNNPIDLKKFNTFSDLQKGQFLLSQYFSLLEINSFKISLSSISSFSEYGECNYFRTSNLILNQYIDHLEYLYKTWVNQFNKNNLVNLKLLSIIQWIKGDINLDPSLSLSDIIYFLNQKVDAEEPIIRKYHHNNLTLVIFYFMSKLKNLFPNNNSDITIENLYSLYPNIPQEIKEVLDGYIGIPAIRKNDSKYDIENRHKYYYTLSDEFLFIHTDVSYERLISLKDRTLLELTFLCSIIHKEVDVNCILYVLDSFNLGYINGSLCSDQETQLIDLRNIICDIDNIKDYHQCNSFIVLCKKMIEQNIIISSNDNLIYNKLIKPFLQTNDVATTLLSNSVSTETLSLISKVDSIIKNVNMEDEEETEDDNIDSEDIDDSSEDDVSEDEDSDDFDSGGEDDSYSDSGSDYSGGTTDIKPIEVPKNVNANTSSSTGIKLELDVNPTLDSVLVKRELLIFVNNLLETKSLSAKQRMILENMKNSWFGVLTSATLIDWLERTLNRSIFKKS